MALTSKQIAGNQKRTMRALIPKLDEMAAAFSDVDEMMVGECQLLIDSAEEYMAKRKGAQNLKRPRKVIIKDG